MPGETQTNALLAACAVTLSGQTIVARGVRVHDAAVVAFTRIENVDSPGLLSKASLKRKLAGEI
jgi:hypothetical protein